MRLRVVIVAALAAALLSAAVAVAATPGTYDGWLYKADGARWKGSFTTLTVRDTARGQRFRLSVYNMRLGCPYLDKYGNQAKARFRFVQQGVVEGQRIDDTRGYPADDPTEMVRVRGSFTGGRFAGRITVSSAPGVAGACTGSARVRASR
jgi:opacity protein-like surface antigen